MIPTRSSTMSDFANKDKPTVNLYKTYEEKKTLKIFRWNVMSHTWPLLI